MTIKDYKKEIETLSLKLGINKSEFIDLEVTNMPDEYLKILSFYKETLDLNSFYGINPSYLIINNNISVNAKAGKAGDNYIIIVYKGLINYLIQSFKVNTQLDSGEIRTFKIIEPYLNTTISELMYQTSLHFTFYHEMAHLIQRADVTDGYLEETPNYSSSYNEEKHIVEVDADKFSSLCISEHILQYHQRLFTSGNSGTYEGLLVLILIPIILYLLSFNSNKTDFYLYEGTHPHPIIRIMLIATTITDYCKKSLSQNGVNINIDHLSIIENALSISQEIEYRYLGTNKVNQLLGLIKVNLKSIMSYAEYIDNKSDSRADLAIYKWNLHAN